MFTNIFGTFSRLDDSLMPTIEMVIAAVELTSHQWLPFLGRLLLNY
jgi:hypothetical protein